MIDLRRASPDRPALVTRFLVGLGVLFVAAAVFGISGVGAVGDLDETVAQNAFDFSEPRGGWVWLLEAIAVVFSNWSVAAVLLVLAGWAWVRKEHQVTYWLVASTAVVLLGNLVLKVIVRRERPVWEFPMHEISSFSFPSGHSAGAGLVATVLILLTIISTGRGLKRRALIVVWVLLGLMIAASRVFLGVHYLTDITAGLAFGAFTTLALWQVLVAGRGRGPADQATLTGSGRKRSAVILNPAKVGDVEEFKAKVLSIAHVHGWGEPLWFETTVEDPGHGQTEAALAEDVDLIIAAGGDGTVRAVCERAVRTGVAVGILPHGTGNLLARNLDIPVNTRDALDVVFAGQDRAIDLASFESDACGTSSFLVMAGLGMDAQIMSGVNDDLKKRVGYLAYFASGLKAVTFPRTKVWITVDDEEPVVYRARTVVVGNVGFLQGGIPLLPEALIDDGLLDVVVVAPKRFIGWLSIVWRIVARRPHNNARLARLAGARVHVRSEKPVPMQLDGDHVGEGTEITASVMPGVVLVRVPVPPLAG